MRPDADDDGLYFGPEGLKRTARRRERDDDGGEYAHDPSRPIVVLDRVEAGYTAFIDPPLPSGDHRVTVRSKSDGWAAASELWRRFGLGLRDLSNPNIGRFVDRE